MKSAQYLMSHATDSTHTATVALLRQLRDTAPTPEVRARRATALSCKLWAQRWYRGEVGR